MSNACTRYARTLLNLEHYCIILVHTLKHLLLAKCDINITLFWQILYLYQICSEFISGPLVACRYSRSRGIDRQQDNTNALGIRETMQTWNVECQIFLGASPPPDSQIWRWPPQHPLTKKIFLYSSANHLRIELAYISKLWFSVTTCTVVINSIKWQL